MARLPFKPFDENGAVRIYYNGFLPHWRQDGCTYFVNPEKARLPDHEFDLYEAEYDLTD